MKPTQTYSTTPAPIREKPMREQLHEILNREQIRLAERGIEGIEALKDRAVKKLAARGIHGIEEAAGDLASFTKRMLLRGLSK